MHGKSVVCFHSKNASLSARRSISTLSYSIELSESLSYAVNPNQDNVPEIIVDSFCASTFK